MPPLMAIKAMLAVQRAMRRQHKLDSPELVVLNERASRVARHTRALAGAGREDEDATAELRRLAGRSRHALSDALKSFKQSDLHLEWRLHNRSVRLLEAAIANTPVAPEDSRSTDRLNQLQRLTSLDPEQAFDELAGREPALAAVHERVASLPARPWPQSTEEMRELARTMSDIHGQLIHMVGRQRPDHDPILASETAFGVCVAYLRRLLYPQGPPRRS